MQSVMPTLVVRDAKAALRFYVEGLGATETARVAGPEGKIMHSTIELGDTTIMVHDEFPEMGALAPREGQTNPMYLYAMVADVDSALERAVQHGARLVRGAQTEFYGHRLGVLVDPFGHMWNLATEVEDIDDAELQRRMAAMS